ncbi:MAG: ribulose-phosphate 3-epimerase [Streptomycetaceae bacterium]|nr:ribulose-phosphate 3-epimerase [Streptomycetaceae bacterium]
MIKERGSSAELIAQLPCTRPLVDVSLWSADLGALATDIVRVGSYADLFHLDVADGHFVPELLFFPDLVAALRPFTTVPFHTHLMVEQPSWLAARMAEAGADLVTVHVETGDQVGSALKLIRSQGKAAGLAVTLDSHIASVLPYLDHTDVIVMISTPLGTKGTEADATTYHRIAAMRALLQREAGDRHIPIIADGGIRRHTVEPLITAGADGVVPGSLIFGSDQPPAATVEWLHSHRRHSTGGV